jgi:glyoxylase-like metal-dependent hydrolase (beta-lactamase superfamily II)
MIRKTLPVGPLQCNCVLLACEKTREAVLIDPGDEAERILALVRSAGVSVKYLLHTHAHFDHVGATRALHTALKAPPCLHPQDQQLYDNLPLQGRYFGMTFEAAPPIEKFLADEEILTFGEHRLQIVHTPGHSPGSICFHLQGADEELFSGDTLFAGSVGRADLWGGDADTLIRSIENRLLVLSDELPVQPGHGPTTTIGRERRENPFLT